MNKTSSKTDAIYKQLRQEILEKQWKVGDKLPTEAEFAKRFDCSIGTISKAVSLLAHEGFVRRKTRLGTTVIPRSENSGNPQQNSFAFIYPSERIENIWRIVTGFQDAAQKAGRRVVMLSTGINYEKEAEFMGRLHQLDVGGAVLYPIIPSPQESVHFSQMLANSQFPVVLAEVNLPGMGCSSVVTDGFHAGYTMARHMVERGAKKIGFFSNYAMAPFMRDRYQGYHWALQEAGLAEPANGVFLDAAMHPNFNDPLQEPTQLATLFLQKSTGIDAVVCADDLLALGCIAAAQKSGIKIPNDLLVSGIGDYSGLISKSPVPLTTYHIPYEEVGRKTFEALDALVSKKKDFPLETQVRGTLVVRSSTEKS